MARKKRVCRLTPKQDRKWVQAFGYYKDEGMSDAKADKAAFEDLAKEYPKLKKCKKIK
jgi:hypothetical protein